METTTQPSQVDVAKSSAEKKFIALKNEASLLANQCLLIKVTDESTLSLASQVASKANGLLKLVEAKRVELKQPSINEGKAIDTLAKDIMNPLQEGVLAVKEELRKWNNKQAELVLQKELENKKLSDKLQAIVAQLTAKADNSKTPLACEELIASINEKFPAFETFGIYALEAKTAKDKFIQLLRIKKATLEASLEGRGLQSVENGIKQMDAVNETIRTNVVSIEEKKEIANETNVVVKSKTRKVWKFEVVNEKELPREFCSPDEGKIRAYMNENKETLDPKGNVTGGVRFFLDEVPMV